MKLYDVVVRLYIGYCVSENLTKRVRLDVALRLW